MNTQSEDLLYGAPAIRKYLGLTSNSVTYHLLESNHLPAFKIGKKWAARKSTLQQHFVKLETGEAS